MQDNRVAPRPSKLDTPEFLLFLVISFILWSIGFVDLLAHPAEDAQYAVLGPYAKGVVALLIGYSLLFLIWLGLAVIPRSHLTLSRTLVYIQDRSWLALGVFGALGMAAWYLLTEPSWLKFPGLSTTLLLLLLIIAIILLLTGWRRHGYVQAWRKAIMALAVVVVSVELIAQSAAYLGLMSGVHLDGGYAPRGRIYQDLEGMGNGNANNYGWYYPDFRLEPNSHRIALIGDTFIQALQIRPQQHLGVLLEDQINHASASEAESEVLALGHPGYGPGLYLDLEMLDFALQAFAPDEIIVAVHLGNDLRNLTRPSELDVYYSKTENGSVEIHPDNFARWHNVAHYTLTGYEPFHPVRVIKSHYLTPVLWRNVAGMVGGSSAASANASPSAAADGLDIPGVRGVITRSGRTIGSHTLIQSMDLVQTPGWSNFLFEKAASADAAEAHEIMQFLLQRFHTYTRDHDVTLRLVTIPVFPAAFYRDFAAGVWSPEIGTYDLLLPERELRELAQSQGIPMLSMGQYMLEGGITTGEIQRMYYSNGTGHFTPEGHAYFAQAIYTCFYAGTQNQAVTAGAACLNK